MRKAAAMLAILLLTGCVSIIDGIYDEQARKDCDQAGRDRSGCYDRVEQNRRERDRD